LILKLTEKIISFLKNDRNYKIKIEYSNRQILSIVLTRFFQICRGLIIRFQFNKSKGFIFAGAKVKIRAGFQINSDKNLILEDGVLINALSKNGVSLGRNVTIARNSILQCTGVIANMGTGIRIGNFSAVGAMSYLSGQGGIEIGNNVIMGPGVKIFSENHNYSKLEIPIRMQGESRIGVKIEDDCWIGADVIILDGVKIGSGSVVAAGSVVTKEIPPFSISAGVPAKVLNNRMKIE